MDDARPGRHDAQVAERRLGPAQQLVALAVALVLAFDVEGEGRRRPEPVDLDRVVDDQVGRHERIDLGRIAAQVGHGVAHHGQVHDGRDPGEVLEDHPRGHERDLGLGRDARPPGRQRLDVLGSDDPVTGVAEQVLEQDLDRDRRAGEVDQVAQDVEPVAVRKARAERGPGAEWVDPWHRVGPRSLATLEGCKRTAHDGLPRPTAERDRQYPDEALGQPARRRSRARSSRDGGGHRGCRHRPPPAAPRRSCTSAPAFGAGRAAGHRDRRRRCGRHRPRRGAVAGRLADPRRRQPRCRDGANGSARWSRSAVPSSTRSPWSRRSS